MKQINNSLKRQESNNLVMWSILIIGTIYTSIFSVSAQNSKLFLIAGQSNAVGNSDDVTKSPNCILGTAFEYNILTDEFQFLKDPIGQNFNNLHQGKGSIGPAFAKTLNSITGEKILIVSAARGGASNSVKGELLAYGTWDETGNLKVFEFAVSKVNQAIKKSGIPLSGIIWLQGERDANAILAGKETESEYKLALEKLISRFRIQFGSKLPFYIVLTGLQTNVAATGSLVVRKVQCEIAKTVPNVHVAYTSTNTFPTKGWLWDYVHYKQEAYNSIGDSVARFVSTLKQDTISHKQN